MANPAKKQIYVGIIGCGKISQAYFDSGKKFDFINIAACADLDENVAKEKAAENNCKALGIKELLNDSNISLIINLTIPSAHASVNRDILQAGKHLYCEKPLTVDLEDAHEVLRLALSKKLLVGCAPDTFLSAGQQTSREIIESGRLGQIKSGTACMLSPGPESWHPNPGFYYLKGAGPVFDMAPYYLTALINFLGPIKSVSAITSKSCSERVATCNERHGEKLPVEVNTHASGTLLFHSGAVITAVFSFDVVASSNSPIELYGTKGSMKVPDPNSFGGPVCSFVLGEDAWIEHELTRVYAENIRGIGVADMVQAILENRQHRATGALAFHVLEVMHAFDKSSESGRTIEIESQPERPAALSANGLD